MSGASIISKAARIGAGANVIDGGFFFGVRPGSTSAFQGLAEQQKEGSANYLQGSSFVLEEANRQGLVRVVLPQEQQLSCKASLIDDCSASLIMG